MQNIQPVWLRYGIIYGIIAIVFLLISYYTTFISTWLQSILGFAVMVFIMSLAGKQLREDQGGFMTFREGFVTVFMTAFVGTAISVLFSIIMMNLIDTNLPDKITEMTIENTRSTMEKLNTPEDTIDELIEEMENNIAGTFTPTKQLMSLGLSGFIIAIFAAIVALILKKERDIFSDDEELVKTTEF